jgi:hypothetical protein
MNVKMDIPAAAACLEVNVIYTGTKETLVALRTAGQLACNLHATIQLLVPQVVPYSQVLDTPTMTHAFTVRKFQTLAEGQQVSTQVQIILCRDRENAFKQALSPHSLIVIGNRKHWWKRRETRLVQALREQGHDVISVAA